MIDVAAYLQRIGFRDRPRGASAELLRELHWRHLFSVPFENLDIHLGREIPLDVERAFDKVVRQRRGGFCYEVNVLFHHLLRGLGFPVRFITSRVYRLDTGEFAPDYGHIANIVIVDGEEWLADVGFGDGFIYPLRLVMEEAQPQRGVTYALREEEERTIRLDKSTDGDSFICQYTFSLRPVQLEEFQPMCRFHQTSPHSIFTQRRLCTLPNERGRHTIAGDELITTVDGVKTTRPLRDEAEFHELLRSVFGIRL